MHRKRKDIPDFARHLPSYILDPRSASCTDSKPAKASDADEELTDPALELELASLIEGVS